MTSVAWEQQSLLDRMVTAVELVKDRLRRATTALDAAGVAYAVVGGNAVAAWVATKNPRAVRNTADVDLLFRRGDLDAAETALRTAGFIRRHAAGIDFFQDGKGADFVDSVHVVFAGEKVRPAYAAAAPDVTEAVERDGVRLLDLESLVRMKLTSFRRKDQVHLEDFLGVGLIDATWTTRFSTELADRLQQLIDTPEG